MDWFLLAFISAVFSAVSAVSEKKSLFSLGALEFSYLSSVIALVFTIPFFIIMPPLPPLSAELVLLLIKTLMGAGAFFCVMSAIKNLEISEALPLLALSPAFVAVAGVIFINDTLAPTEWAALILMAAGTYILELRSGNNGIAAPVKALFDLAKYKYIILALILFTGSSLIDRLLLKDYKLAPYTFTALQQLFYTLIFLIAVAASKKNPVTLFRLPDKKVLGLLVALGIFTVIYRYTQIEATKLAPVALVLSVKRLSVLMAVFGGGKIFKEKEVPKRVLAAVIILSGAMILLINGIK
ncbi:MAG: EamA family transporter [Ignavibacteriaceae bacterium]|nr:EamA family transporter [Ignavibacteriaceae bacterium]